MFFKKDPLYGLVKDDTIKTETTKKKPITLENKHLKSFQISPCMNCNHGDDKRIIIWERKPNSLSLYRVYVLFNLDFIPERIKHHIATDFFNLTREPETTTTEKWSSRKCKKF